MEAQTIQNRVYLLDERIIYVRELHPPTAEGVSQSARYIKELSQQWDDFGIVVEFPGFAVPDATVRHRVVEEVMPLKTKLRHVAVVTDTNVFMTVTIKFIAALSGFRSISVHKSCEEALREVQNKLREIH